MSGKSFFHVVFYKTQRLYVHFGKILRAQRLYIMSFSRKSSEHKGCMSILSSTRFGRSVIIHDVDSRQDGVKPVGMLRPGLPPLGFSPKILGFSIQSWVLGFFLTALGFF